MKTRIISFLVILAFSPLWGQESSKTAVAPDKPKLIVGVVVDQMRYDYITRFWDKYSEDGFKRLVGHGFNFRNNHFNYIPTYTAPGHASVYTGTSPQNHGIIGNDWYDKFEGKSVYCVEDDEVSSIGTASSAGKMSPHRMMATSVADENRLFTQLRGKSIGIAIKDRGAILPAGHTANAAYWFYGREEGKWITSSWYMNELPSWVQDFNKSGKVQSYLKTWNTLYDIAGYEESGADKNVFERGYRGKDSATFPYDLKKLAPENGQLDILKETPYGNSITTDFAIAALSGEGLGLDEHTDFLTVSYSSTDYVGHNFGVNSKEIQDTYLRLDLDLARLLKELDEKVGEGNYTLFITADHGGVEVPAYLRSLKIPADYFESRDFQKDLHEFVKNRFQTEGLISNVSNNQIFFNYDKFREQKIERTEVEDAIAHFVLQLPLVNRVFTRSQMEGADFTSGTAGLVQNGFSQRRSGDVMMVLDPATISYSRTGSTHGSGFNYDTHAPLIFFGKGVRSGSSVERSEITDIAPTISVMLGISFPNAATGNPLNTHFED